MVQNHAPDSRPGHASQAFKLLTEPFLEEGGFMIAKSFVDMVDKTRLQFGAESCFSAGIIARLISSAAKARLSPRSATRFQPDRIGKLLWGPSLIVNLQMSALYK